MENLAPSLRFILKIRYLLECGNSLSVALREYLKDTNDDFSRNILRWYSHFERGTDFDLTKELKSPTQIVLLHLLKRGLQGHPIHSKLIELETEVVERCRNELSSYTQQLSFRLLVPLLLFQFPALLILFLGFLTNQVSRSFQ